VTVPSSPKRNVSRPVTFPSCVKVMRYVPAALDEHSAAAAFGLTAPRLATKDTASPVRATDRLKCFIASPFVSTTGHGESIDSTKEHTSFPRGRSGLG